MKKQIKILAMLSIIMMATSCKKNVYGCTDTTAVNYDAKATTLKVGSCTYTGQSTFYCNQNLGVTTVIISGQMQKITKYFPNGISVCGEYGCAAFTLPAGIYVYYASNATRNWTGNITILGNNCARILLN